MAYVVRCSDARARTSGRTRADTSADTSADTYRASATESSAESSADTSATDSSADTAASSADSSADTRAKSSAQSARTSTENSADTSSAESIASAAAESSADTSSATADDDAAKYVIHANVTLPDRFVDAATRPSGGLRLRLRAPKQAGRMSAVTLGGRPWAAFDPIAETVDFAAGVLTEKRLEGLKAIVAEWAAT